MSLQFLHPGLNQYYFVPRDDVANPSYKICQPDTGSGPATLGNTFLPQTHAPNPVIILCPVSFTLGATATLGTVAPAPPPAAGDAGTQSLELVQPYSFTFLHEMFHYGAEAFLHHSEDPACAYLSFMNMTKTHVLTTENPKRRCS
jgi:hypothetical protein